VVWVKRGGNVVSREKCACFVVLKAHNVAVLDKHCAVCEIQRLVVREHHPPAPGCLSLRGDHLLTLRGDSAIRVPQRVPLRVREEIVKGEVVSKHNQRAVGNGYSRTKETI